MSTSAENTNPSDSPRPQRRKKKYVPAVTPRLRIFLMMVFALFALLAANSIYLASITFLESITERTYQDYFYLCMFMLHLVLGVLIILPFIIFAFYHLLATKNRKNRRAVRIGYALLGISILLLVSGILLTRVAGLELKQELTRQIVYWAHVISPLGAVWLYWLHRLAGPPIKWRVGLTYAGVVAAVLVPLVYLQFQDPRQWSVEGSPEGEKYFFPSEAVTSTANFIPENVLNNNEYCLKCHQDVHAAWSDSAHRFSSFNNPAYLTSIVELRETLEERDGDVRASRWCAGCHDPVPFFSGQFDNPEFDVIDAPSGQAGITCTACHAITNVNSHRGNADYTIEEPIHYPFASSDNEFLSWVSNQLVKAKPSFHKKTFLKPLHQTGEFCGTCHKVSLPKELNHYKEFLRGQNHYDPWLLSGVSGHGLRSFYYPPKAQTNCNNCHLPLKDSNDFGAKDFAGTGKLQVHDHLFPSANTGIAWMRGRDEVVKAHQDFLKDVMKVDIFGLKEGNSIEAPLTGPIRPEVPELAKGQEYLLETVIRTAKMGHLFTQGTVDSNEVWMDVTVLSGAEYDADGNRTAGTVIGRSGGMDEKKEVDPWSHFINVFMLDKDGNRINRRNAQDIFTPLYNHQIPPGAGQIVHYQLYVPEEIQGTLTVELKLQYRKFDQEYMDIINDFHKKYDLPLRGSEVDGEYKNDLPVTTLAYDRVTFTVAGEEGEASFKEPSSPEWMRWNDYGIGLLMEGTSGGGRGELRQAEHAFQQVERLGQFHGPINLARTYQNEGRLADAVEALSRAVKYQDDEGYPAWTVLWLSGVINRQEGNLDDAIENFDAALNYQSEETIEKQFDFSIDYVVINELGQTYFERSQIEVRRGNATEETRFLNLAVEQFKKTLEVDMENVTAHFALAQVYERLGKPELAQEHRELHAKYEPDYNAGDSARVEAKKRYPAAVPASKPLVIYPLNRPGAPELPAEAERAESVEEVATE